MQLLPTDAGRIAMVGDFPGVTPASLFDYFTTPDLLTKWWPKEAVIEPQVGGKYWLSWPAQGWTLRGEITCFEPGTRFGFTWLWDHGKKGFEPLRVLIGFGATDSGSILFIEHGPFGEGDAEAREGIIEGWLHFGAQLRTIASGS